MKKTLTAIIIALLMTVIFTMSAGAYNLGDINNDGRITAADARLALRSSAKLETLTEEQTKAADVDGNGKVTAADARMILRTAAGLASITGESAAKGLVIEDGILHIAVCADNKPFAYTENGELTGYDVDYAKRLAKALGLQIKFKEKERSEIKAAIDNKECDIAISGFSADDETKENYSLSKPYFNNTLYVIVRKNWGVNSLSDLDYTNVGVIKNSFAHTYCSAQIENGSLENARINAYEDSKTALQSLDRYDISAFITSDLTVLNTMNEVYDFTYFEHLSQNNVICVSKENTALTEIINTAVAQLNTNELRNKYIENIKKPYIKTDVSSLTLSPGGTGLIKVEIYSPYVTSHLDAHSSNVTSVLIKDEYAIEDAYFLFVSADSNVSDIIDLTLFEPDNSISVSIPVYIRKNTNDAYKINCGTLLDFGAFTSTAPYAAEIGVLNGGTVMAFTYDIESVLENGADDNVLLDYTEKIEQKGFVPLNYYEYDDMFTLYYYNEDTMENIYYCEFLDREEYVIAVGIAISY